SRWLAPSRLPAHESSRPTGCFCLSCLVVGLLIETGQGEHSSVKSIGTGNHFHRAPELHAFAGQLPESFRVSNFFQYGYFNCNFENLRPLDAPLSYAVELHFSPLPIHYDFR